MPHRDDLKFNIHHEKIIKFHAIIWIALRWFPKSFNVTRDNDESRPNDSLPLTIHR